MISIFTGYVLFSPGQAEVPRMTGQQNGAGWITGSGREKTAETPRYGVVRIMAT